MSCDEIIDLEFEVNNKLIFFFRENKIRVEKKIGSYQYVFRVNVYYIYFYHVIIIFRKELL